MTTVPPELVTKAEVLEHLARTLGFPEHAARNLDALYDVLTTDIAGPVTIDWQAGESEALAPILTTLRAAARARPDLTLREAPRITAVLETVLYARDLEATKRFYRDVLGIPVHSEKPGLFVFFRLAGQMLLIFEPDAAAKGGRDVPPHGSHGDGHLCFAVPADLLGDWRSHLTRHGIAIEQEHTWPNGALSLYFRDPAGNSLELAAPDLWGFDERLFPTSSPGPKSD